MPAAQEGSETGVVIVAGRASLEVRSHSWNRLVGIGAGQLQLDIAIQLLEALLAAELGPLRAKQGAQHLVVLMPRHASSFPSSPTSLMLIPREARNARSFCRAS